MMPCLSGTEALYRPADAADGDERELLAVRVEAWDDLGAPLVAGRQGLVPASAFRGSALVFVRLDPHVTWTGHPAEEARRVPVTPPQRERVLDPPPAGVARLPAGARR